ncbi:MAG: chemotaxis protein CheC [Clostridiales Family XIII bacterium]|nr:chemotaxis protein CheC [Clostridiales Family XIII bacterium]
MINSYNELQDSHIDVLREIGNIGAGNAATSLSVLLDESVTISIPNVKVEGYDNVVRAIGEPEDLAIAILVNFHGDVRGTVLFILPFEDAKLITQMLVGIEKTDDHFLSEMKISTIKEFGNILGSSYLGSIASLTGLNFDISVPYAAIDMLGALLAAPVIEFGAFDSKIMFIEETFSTEERKLNSHVILFADMPSLNKIMTRLGLEI